MRTLYLLSVWLHVLAVAVWVGGMVTLALVLVPLTRRPEYRDVAPSIIRRTGLSFRWLGWMALGVLLATGVFNLAYRGIGWEDLLSPQLWQVSVGQALGVKLLLVAVVFLLSALHDFFIGPRASAAWQADPASHEAARLRRKASWIAWVNLLLALIITALGVVVSRGGF